MENNKYNLGDLVIYDGFQYTISAYSQANQKVLLTRQRSTYETEQVQLKWEELTKLEKVNE